MILKILLFFSFAMVNLWSVNAQEVYGGFFNVSYAYEFDNINNISIGQNILITPDNYLTLNNHSFHWIGLNYRYCKNGNIFNMEYLLEPNFAKIKNHFFVMYGVFSYGLGTNISYNINKNIFGIGPQINLRYSAWIIFYINLTYRYNIYFNEKNIHEIGLSIGVQDFFGEGFLKALP